MGRRSVAALGLLAIGVVVVIGVIVIATLSAGRGTGPAALGAPHFVDEAAAAGLDFSYQGDAQHGPNPCIGPIERGPYYAIKMVIGDLGTYAGIKTDEHARALDENGQPIAGLYAAGNDMASIMGGNYPGAGITLGPALTFGYIAGRHIAG